MHWALSPRILPWIIAVTAAAVLVIVHSLEAYGWIPCELCLRQRIPYWIAMCLALASAIAAVPQLNLASISSALIFAAAITFLIGAGLAVQHIGVEQHWWKSTCSGGGGKPSITDLLASVGKKPIVPCDERRPFLFGLTLTSYNLIVSIALAALAASVPLRQLKGRAT